MSQLEIERKFVLARKPAALLEGVRGEEILQGYILLDDSKELRIRNRAGRCTMTLKHGHGLQRREQECRIEKEQFEMLWPLTEGRCIEKTRYLVRRGTLDYEIDLFSGDLAPLMMLEVEFPDVSSSEDFIPPDFVDREVTEDRAYKNASLAAAGVPATVEETDE